MIIIVPETLISDIDTLSSPYFNRWKNKKPIELEIEKNYINLYLSSFYKFEEHTLVL